MSKLNLKLTIQKVANVAVPEIGDPEFTDVADARARVIHGLHDNGQIIVPNGGLEKPDPGIYAFIMESAKGQQSTLYLAFLGNSTMLDTTVDEAKDTLVRSALLGSSNIGLADGQSVSVAARQQIRDFKDEVRGLSL